MDEIGLGSMSLPELCRALRRRAEPGRADADAEADAGGGPGAFAVALGTPKNYDDTAWAQARLLSSPGMLLRMGGVHLSLPALRCRKWPRRWPRTPPRGTGRCRSTSSLVNESYWCGK